MTPARANGASTRPLTPPSRQVYQWLLDWDRDRIARNRARNPRLDRRDYEARQVMAQHYLDRPPAEWPAEVDALFLSLIDVLGNLQMPGRASIAVREIGDRGVARVRMEGFPVADVRARRRQIVTAAAEAGILPRLQRASSAWWRDALKEE